MYAEAIKKTHVGSIITEIIGDLQAPGSPTYSPSRPPELGFERTDVMLKGYEIFESIYKQGMLLAGVDVIDTEDGYEILVFNTAAASTHTVFKVPYDAFDKEFRQQASAFNYVLYDGPLIAGVESQEEIQPPQSVPLDMLTWVMRRRKEDQLILPVDLGDLRSQKTGNPDIDNYLLHLKNKKLTEVFEAIVKRGTLATRTIQNLYENTIRKEIPYLPKQSEADVMQGALQGYYRGDDVKMLAQHHDDGRGNGPMSNPTTHFRYTQHLTMDVLNNLNHQNPRKNFYEFVDDLKQHDRFFGNDITFAQMRPLPAEQETEGEVIKKLLEDYAVIDLLKVIDPYASLAHNYLEQWATEQLHHHFNKLPVHSIKGFQHHTSDYERELRVSEGVEVVLATARMDGPNRQRLLAESLTRVTAFVGDVLYPLWEDVNNFVVNKTIIDTKEREVQLQKIQQKYELPPVVMTQIQALQPTERQLKKISMQEGLTEDQQARIARKQRKYEKSKERTKARKKELMEKIQDEGGTLDDLMALIYYEQYGQLFDDPEMNTGYNIPGVPSGALTYHTDDEGNIHINFGWLMSMKGLSELWLGAMIKRLERKG